MSRNLRPFEYNVVNKGFTRVEYSVEGVPVPAGSEWEARIRGLFAQVRPGWCVKFGWPDPLAKGLVRIVP